LYGAGLRLLEACRLRIQDLDFAANQITIRDGKGDKDRLTMLPHAVKADLMRHLERVRTQHARDLRHGAGWVELPWALGRKYPNAGREWGWQWASRRPVSTSIASPGSGAVITSMNPCFSGRSRKTVPASAVLRQSARRAAWGDQCASTSSVFTRRTSPPTSLFHDLQLRTLATSLLFREGGHSWSSVQVSIIPETR